MNGVNLIIMCEHTDREKQDYDCATYAILDKHEAIRLAGRLKTTLLDLPLEIAESMSEWRDMACPLYADVRDCFKEITECLIAEGCHFKIKRKFHQVIFWRLFKIRIESQFTSRFKFQ